MGSTVPWGGARDTVLLNLEVSWRESFRRWGAGDRFLGQGQRDEICVLDR